MIEAFFSWEKKWKFTSFLELGIPLKTLSCFYNCVSKVPSAYLRLMKRKKPIVVCTIQHFFLKSSGNFPRWLLRTAWLSQPPLLFLCRELWTRSYFLVTGNWWEAWVQRAAHCSQESGLRSSPGLCWHAALPLDSSFISCSDFLFALIYISFHFYFCLCISSRDALLILWQTTGRQCHHYWSQF